VKTKTATDAVKDAIESCCRDLPLEEYVAALDDIADYVEICKETARDDLRRKDFLR
jgi:hypothetical protein